jgi:hypothetical protein
MVNVPDQSVDWIGFSILEIFSKGREITFLTMLGGDALEPSCLDFFTFLVFSSDGRFLQSLATPLPVLLLLACKKHIQTRLISVDIVHIYIYIKCHHA